MRKDVYELFSRYESCFQYQWNRIIAAGFDNFSGELSKLAAGKGFKQEIGEKRVFWKNLDGDIEAMFSFIIDPTDLKEIVAMYSEIRMKKIPVTFAFIEQLQDGRGQYDIFRLSENSYLEHCNRAWKVGTSPDS